LHKSKNFPQMKGKGVHIRPLAEIKNRC